MLTRITFTFVYIHITVLSDIADVAVAMVIFHVIFTGSSIDARIPRAIINIDFAVNSRVSRIRAVARVTIQTVYTLGTVHARG